MQVYVPTSSIRRNVRALDDRRLNAQLGEIVQIIKAASGLSKGWVNHPAVGAWKFNTGALYQYGLHAVADRGKM